MTGSNDLAIATWFVDDSGSDGTFFPQVGGLSSDAGVKSVYWRCVVTFYATSMTRNPSRQHIFFTNTDLPTVDGVDVGGLLERWGVDVVRLPITYRLPPGRVSSWGNQFYIFDILDHVARTRQWSSIIILDSDVVWTDSGGAIEAAVREHGLITYLHDVGAYNEGDRINGVTREELARFASLQSGSSFERIAYCGGEIFAGTLTEVTRVAQSVPPLWESIRSGAEGAPQEEAHLLSVIYALNGYPLGTANPFIKRMWTSLRYNNVNPQDRELALWHLPAEKRTGFKDLFDLLRARGLETIPPGAETAPWAVPKGELSRIFGVPQRSLRKLTRDSLAKARERISHSRRS